MTLATAKLSAVAAWTLDEASGTRADSVGSNDLTDNNTVGVDTGLFGNAADFEVDNNEYLSIADNADLSCGDVDFTFVVWLKPETSLRGKYVAGKGLNGTTNLEWHVSCAGISDTLNFTVGYGSAQATVSRVSTITTGVWHLLVVSHDSVNNLLSISWDGSSPTTLAHTDGVNDGASTFVLGNRGASTSGSYDGLMDDAVFLKGYVLSATEITELWNSGTGVAFADWSGGAGNSVSLSPVSIQWSVIQPSTELSRSISPVDVNWTPIAPTTDIQSAVTPAVIDWTAIAPATTLEVAVSPVSVEWTAIAPAIEAGLTISPVLIEWVPVAPATDLSVSISPVAVEWVPVEPIASSGLVAALDPVVIDWTLIAPTTALETTISPATIKWQPVSPDTALETTVTVASIDWTPIAPATDLASSIALSPVALEWTVIAPSTDLSIIIDPVSIEWTLNAPLIGEIYEGPIIISNETILKPSTANESILKPSTANESMTHHS